MASARVKACRAAFEALEPHMVQPMLKAFEAGLVAVVWDDNDGEYQFQLTREGRELVEAGGTVAGMPMAGTRLN